MIFKITIITFIVSLFCVSTFAQGLFFEVISIEGTGKVQRSQKREWEKITIGTKLFDNDLVETYFQTKMIMRFGENNIVILGSNSKALLNIVNKEDANGIKTNVNLTLFGGGIFAKAISNCHISFYSANAVGEMDSGAVSTVADSKNGETGFQVLGGSVYVRNIAQQKGITLRAGLTTMILPNKEPTAPVYLTHRHAAVLKHFFGEDYINSELEASGVEPTDERGTSSRLALSQNLSINTTSNNDQSTYKSLFSPSKVYGSILSDNNSALVYTPVIKPRNATSRKGYISFNSDLGFSSKGVKPSFTLVPSLKLPVVDAALRFSLGLNSSSAMNSGFSSLQSILDKIHYLYLGKYSDSLYLFIGRMEDYSLGYGLIVDNFTSNDPGRIFNSPGISGQFRIKDNLDLKFFLGNITIPYYGGIYINYLQSVYTIGAGYYFDFNQYKTSFETDDFRYAELSEPEAYVPDQNQYPSNSHIYEIDIAAQVISNYDFQMNMLLEFAQKLQGGNDGIVARIPTIMCDINKMRFGAAIVVETKRLLSSHFSPIYLTNRYRIKKDQSGFYEDTILTQNNSLSQKRQSTGFALTFKANPIKGMDVDVYYKQDFASKNTLNLFHSTFETDSARDIPGDFTLMAKCKVNDSLVPFFKYADIYVQQYHGRLYPGDSKIFSSWGMQSGFNILTQPIFKNMAFEAGGKLLYIDGNSNNAVDNHDFIFEFCIGMQWGFL